ncbi:MAG: hypothetical protein IIC01_08490 [Planctomycetes bacterium]|nr:hypothetical protein [Planctomycetota bacterium]
MPREHLGDLPQTVEAADASGQLERCHESVGWRLRFESSNEREKRILSLYDRLGRFIPEQGFAKLVRSENPKPEARLRATGCGLRATGCGLQTTGYRLRDTGYRLQDTGSSTFNLQPSTYASNTAAAIVAVHNSFLSPSTV